MTLRLVVFDVDGTLVDSQGHIVAAMAEAFSAQNLPTPARKDILGIVGLSLPEAMARLAPEADAEKLTDDYKTAYAALRQSLGSATSSPLYSGAKDCIEALHAVPDILLGIATGKSRRGLDTLLDAHRLRPYFVTLQHADAHPSKPHPSMLQEALRDTGVEPQHAIMVGDSSYDMDMARAAGITAIGVSWGYQPPENLRADLLAQSFQDLTAHILHLAR